MNTQTFKLGKQAAKHDPRTLKLSTYLKGLPVPPDNAGYIQGVRNWGFMLNDALGDCTVACAGHEMLQWSTYAGHPFRPTDAQILQAYSAVSGYTPGDPNSDVGAVVLNVLKYWRKIGIAGHKILAFVSVDPKNHTEVKQAIQLFGNVYLGIGLPITAQRPTTGVNGLPVWSMPKHGVSGDGAPWSWGGHACPAAGFGSDAKGNTGLEVITWGQVYDMTWGFFDTYVDEAYCILSLDWIDGFGTAPSGFDLATLQADLAAL